MKFKEQNLQTIYAEIYTVNFGFELYRPFKIKFMKATEKQR